MKHLLFIILFVWAGIAHGTIKVVTSLPDLADFTRQVGGDRVTVDNIVRGDQNPHFVEVKPSYMMKLKAADVFFLIGMDLEMWAPQIIDGSRNTKLMIVDLSKRIDKLEIPEKLDASQGDVHRYGNPHYWLDPRNIRIIVEDIVAALARVSPGDEQFFRANGEAYLKKIDGKILQWSATMKPFTGAKIVTFHKSWTYFARWLGLAVTDQVEPKPGIAPSPSHTAELISLIREAAIKVIVVEPFYDTSAADQIARATGASVLRLCTSTGGVDGTGDYLALMDYNIATLAGALK
jgi:zinc/manganese transport system substrate-binding protein